MADSIQVNSNTGVDGNSYTSSISNDQLTNEDFLKLMIQELKLQDPTKPMDSAQMLSTQMQMSNISTNQATIEAMKSLQTSFSQSALSNAANIIGKNIEDGNIGEDGVNKAYTVRSVENVDGEVQVKAQQILYIEDRVVLSDGDSTTPDSVVDYNVNGEIIDSSGTLTGQKIVLTNVGQPLVSDGKLTILDENNEIVTEHKFQLAGVSVPVYSDILTTLPFSTISKIF